MGDVADADAGHRADSARRERLVAFPFRRRSRAAFRRRGFPCPRLSLRRAAGRRRLLLHPLRRVGHHRALLRCRQSALVRATWPMPSTPPIARRTGCPPCQLGPPHARGGTARPRLAWQSAPRRLQCAQLEQQGAVDCVLLHAGPAQPACGRSRARFRSSTPTGSNRDRSTRRGFWLRARLAARGQPVEEQPQAQRGDAQPRAMGQHDLAGARRRHHRQPHVCLVRDRARPGRSLRGSRIGSKRTPSSATTRRCSRPSNSGACRPQPAEHALPGLVADVRVPASAELRERHRCRPFERQFESGSFRCEHSVHVCPALEDGRGVGEHAACFISRPSAASSSIVVIGTMLSLPESGGCGKPRPP